MELQGALALLSRIPRNDTGAERRRFDTNDENPNPFASVPFLSSSLRRPPPLFLRLLELRGNLPGNAEGEALRFLGHLEATLRPFAENQFRGGELRLEDNAGAYAPRFRSLRMQTA